MTQATAQLLEALNRLASEAEAFFEGRPNTLSDDASDTLPDRCDVKERFNPRLHYSHPPKFRVDPGDFRAQLQSFRAPQDLVDQLGDEHEATLERLRLLQSHDYDQAILDLAPVLKSSPPMDASTITHSIRKVFESRFRTAIRDAEQLILDQLAASLQTTSKSRTSSDLPHSILEEAWSKESKITVAEKKRLAKLTGLTTRQVSVWFANQRQRRRGWTSSSSSSTREGRPSNAEESSTPPRKRRRSVDDNTPSPAFKRLASEERATPTSPAFSSPSADKASLPSSPRHVALPFDAPSPNQSMRSCSSSSSILSSSSSSSSSLPSSLSALDGVPASEPPHSCVLPHILERNDIDPKYDIFDAYHTSAAPLDLFLSFDMGEPGTEFHSDDGSLEDPHIDVDHAFWTSIVESAGSSESLTVSDWS